MTAYRATSWVTTPHGAYVTLNVTRSAGDSASTTYLATCGVCGKPYGTRELVRWLERGAVHTECARRVAL